MVAGADLRRAVRLLACVTGVSDNPYSNFTLRISLRIHHLQKHKTKKPSSQTPVEKHPFVKDATPFGVGVWPDGFDCLLGFHT
jgi:hypothetical protein